MNYSHYYSNDDFNEFYAYRDFYRLKKRYSEKKEILQPLSDHLKKVDDLKDVILNHRVSLNSLVEMAKLLNSDINLISSRLQKKPIALSRLKDIDEAFFDAGLGNVVLDVRRGPFMFPAYCLCECTKSYTRNYGLITAEFYLSSDYVISDDRFLQLMYNGHEIPFIRMSSFRDRTAAMFGVNPDADQKADDLLKSIGDHFLQSSWHEDQEIAHVLNQKLGGLSLFNEATELLFFILGTDLSLARGNITPEVKKFFENVYPRPTLARLLSRIENGGDAEMKELEKRSRSLYQRCSRMFSEFLQTHVNWGPEGIIKGIPFYKIVFSNLSRLGLLEGLKEDPAIQMAIKKLEGFGEEALAQINEKFELKNAEYKIFDPD